MRVFLSLFWQEVLAPAEWLILGLIAVILSGLFGWWAGIVLLGAMFLVVCTWSAIAAYRYVKREPEDPLATLPKPHGWDGHG